jgi:hypothetical protein
VRLSVRQGIVQRDSLPVFRIAEEPYAKSPARAREGTLCLVVGRIGLDSASTIHTFSFSFFCQAWKIVENCRKMVKLWDQFF